MTSPAAALRRPAERSRPSGRIPITLFFVLLMSLCAEGSSSPKLARSSDRPSHVASPSFGLRPAIRARRSGFHRSRNTHGTHYFLGTSAIPLPKGEGWYKNTLVSLNSATIGVTQHLAIGASLDLVSLVTARANGPIWSTRMQVNGSISDNVHLGACAFYLRTQLPSTPDVGPFNAERPPGLGAALGLFTFGNADHQITVGGGVTYDGENTGRGPLMHIAGLTRLFPNVALVTEHWVVSDPERSFLIHSFGARVIGQNLAIDAGLAYDKDVLKKVTPVGLPFLSATLNF